MCLEARQRLEARLGQCFKGNALQLDGTFKARYVSAVQVVAYLRAYIDSFCLRRD